MNKSLLERFNQLTLREKTMVVSTLLVVVWSAWDKLVYQPLTKQLKQLDSELIQIQTTLLNQQQLAVQIENVGKIDLDSNNKQQLKKLQAKIKYLKKQLDVGEKQFVPAQQMAKVLGNILKESSGLELLTLKTLAVSPLLENDQNEAQVFRHGLSYTLSGNFFNTLNYLKKLESLPWRFNWDSIEYQVTQYPMAETTLRIYTLSFEENWLEI